MLRRDQLRQCLDRRIWRQVVTGGFQRSFPGSKAAHDGAALYSPLGTGSGQGTAIAGQETSGCPGLEGIPARRVRFRTAASLTT